jgi:lipopolysaccharide export LptBFGC system permease protein LptF
MPWKLYKYILNKFVSTFAAAVAIFTVLFLMDQASRQVEQLAPHASSLRDFLLSFLLLAPPLLAYTIPLAFLMAMIWTLEQMKQEREITAIMSTGTSPVRLLPPFLAASAVTFISEFIITAYAGPASFRKYNDRLTGLARQSFINELQPGLLFSGIPNTLLLVGGFDRASGRIDGLLMIRNDLDDTETGEMILAKKGMIQPPSSETRDIILKLENGTIHPVASGEDVYRSGSFDSLISRVQSRSSVPGVRAKQFLMASSNQDLRTWSDESGKGKDKELSAMYAIELNRRFAFPLTILLYPFVIFPLAVSTGRHGKLAAFSGSMILFLTSFFLFSIGSNLARQGMIPASLGAWFPILFLLIAGLAIFPAYFISQRGRS